MPSESEGEGDCGFTEVKKPRIKKRKNSPTTDEENGGGSLGTQADKFKPFFKPNYQRLYPDTSNHNEFAVFLESTNDDKLGNKDPIAIQKIIGKFIKGQYEMSRASAQKLKIIFKQSTDANDFLCNEKSLEKVNIRAFIPSSFVEKIGVIHHISTELSNEDLYRKVSGEFEIVAVRRFMKKTDDGTLEPMKTVTVTFVTAILPQFVYLDHWRIPVSVYVQPIMQCYKCLKFNHSAKVCKNSQVCSVCAGEHSYKDCTKDTDFKCSNCGGAHLAISKICPVKMDRIAKQRNSYANVAKTLTTQKENYSKSFPAISQTSRQPLPVNPIRINTNEASPQLKTQFNNSLTSSPTELVNLNKVSDIDDRIINAMVKTLVILGNMTESVPKNAAKIKEILLKNL